MVIVTTVSVEQWGQMPKGVPKRMQLQRKERNGVVAGREHRDSRRH